MRRLAIVMRGAALVVCLGAFALWAALFLEHLTWFGLGSPPPARLWLAQFAHALVAVGLLAAVWRRAIGAALTAAALLAFLALAGWPRATGLVALTLAPFVLFGLSNVVHRSTRLLPLPR
jgi:hypothetical protein